jgi:DNA-binding LacI/PurR family transcriptional regulator
MVERPVNHGASNAARERTILDVAREAGVSKSTVSRVLNGSPHVAHETRGRVLEIVNRLDFRANAAARGLRTTKSSLVGLLLPAIDNDVFGRVAEVIEQDLRREGIGLVIASSGWDADGEQLALESLRARRVDALVLSLVNDRDPRLGELLATITRPIVLIDRELAGGARDRALTDLRSGVREAVEHLAGLGHRSIGIATISLDVLPGREVRSEFEASVASLELDAVFKTVVPYDRMDRRSGWEIAERALAAGASALLCCVPNIVTAGVLEHLDQQGVSIPERISIIAFDESELASVKKPQLTVIYRPIDDLARFASRMVVSRLADPGLRPRVEVVRTSLRVRNSTAAPVVLSGNRA